MRVLPHHRGATAALLLAALLSAGLVTATAPDPVDELHLDCLDRFHVGAAQRDLAGWTLANVGDITGNGRADIAIGAPFARSAGPQSGSVHVPSDTGSDGLGQSILTFTGEDATDQAGTSIAAAGDVNGDAKSDILIGAPYADDTFSANYGAAYLFHGPRVGTHSLSDADAIIRGTATGRLGSSVAGVGDVNGDGNDDVLIAAPYMSTHALGDGAAYLFYGPFSGSLTVADADAWFTGEAGMDLIGTSLARLGDINGDGLDDFAIGAPHHDNDRGTVYIIHGAATRAVHTSLVDADHKITGNAPDDWFGFSIAGVGDVTGNGLPDLAVGAVRNDTTAADAGAAYVFAGPLGATNADQATAAIHGHSIADEFGVAVARIGDINGDGIDDLGVGATTARLDGVRAGAAYVYAGGTAMTGTHDAMNATFVARGIHHGDATGRMLTGDVDLDGDGKNDIYVGAPGYEVDPDVDNTGLVVGLDLDDLADSDADGLSDACERNRYGTDAHNPDTDGDGLSDGNEVLVHGTDPLDADTDGDLFGDGYEVIEGSDPLNPLSVPGPAGPVTAPGPQLLGSTPLDDEEPLFAA